MGKEAFLIYTSFYKPISILSDKQIGRLFRAIFRYNLGEVVDVEDDIRMAFEFFKNQFEIDERKYQTKVMKNNESGRKGGNPNFKKGKPNPYYIKDNAKITEDNSTLPKITEDNPINVNDNVNENDEYIPPIVPQGDDGHPLSHEEKIDYNVLMETFNKMFEGKLPKITSMTDKRKKAVKARASEHGKNAIMTVFQNVLHSSFLMGRNDKNWSCDFDWIFRPTNFIKILEGNYNGNRNIQNERDSQQRKLNSAVAVATRVQEAAAKKRAELQAEGVID